MRQLATVLALLAGCGSALPEVPCDVQPEPSVCLGLDRVHTPRATADSPDPLPLDIQRWRYALEQGASWWGVAVDDLQGLNVGLTASFDVCGRVDVDACQLDDKVWLWVPDGRYPCPEWSLPHEIGHFLIGDSDHRDPRFQYAFCALADLTGCTPRIDCNAL